MAVFRPLEICCHRRLTSREPSFRFALRYTEEYPQRSLMNRFHVHVTVPDLDNAARFYLAMFKTEPVSRVHFRKSLTLVHRKAGIRRLRRQLPPVISG